MSDKILLSAEKRDVTGKKVRSMRKDGKVPATVYQKNKESFSIVVDYNPMMKVWAAAGTGQPVELHVGKDTHIAMIKDVHMDPAKNTLMHVAFHAVDKNRQVEAEIPVHIVGDVPAEQQGNFIVRANDQVVIKAKPADLPEFIEISADKLIEPGDKLHASDLTIPENTELISEPELTLASVEEPRAVEEPEPEEEIDAADVPSDNGGDEEGESEKPKDDSSEA